MAINGDLAAASMSEGRIEIFALGADSSIWHQNWDGKNWVGWESLGGKFATPPTVARGWGLEVFSSDAQGTLWRLSFSGRGSRDWKQSKISFSGSLAAASMNDGVAVFGLAPGTSAVSQALCAPQGDCTLLGD